jgi:ATP-dependent helicase/DNAse subunit B
MEKGNNIKLSPTGIACYHECPRKFYYIYIRGIEEKPTPSKVRGKIVHRVLEHFFTFVDLANIQQEHWHRLWKKFRNVLFSLLETEWKQIGKIYEDCFKDERQKTRFFNETKEFLDFYAIKLAFSLMNKMNELDKNSEWFESDIRGFSTRKTWR